MLDVLRRHATSWLIKVILGAIIITFIFFFGYSSYRKGMRGGRAGAEGAIAVRVNGTPVSLSEFEFYFDRNFERMRSSFGNNEVPDFVRKIAQSTTVKQLVSREIALQQTDELGITIPNEELADIIKKTPTLGDGNEFDPIAYRYRFLPYFKNRYGLDYEQLVRQDLRLETLEGLFQDISSEETDKESKKTTWTFEVVTIDPNTMVASKVIGSADEAPTIAEKVINTDPRGWKKLFHDMKIETKKVGPIDISERQNILSGEGPIEDFYAIFTLTREKPVIQKPIQRNGKLYVIRLVENSEKSVEPKPHQTADFFQVWMEKLLAKAKVENYLDAKP